MLTALETSFPPPTPCSALQGVLQRRTHPAQVRPDRRHARGNHNSHLRPVRSPLPEAGMLAPHPTDCSRYYVCLADGLAIEHDCEAGYYFDYKTGMCSEDDSYCYQYCDPCKPHCTHVYQRVPDPYNCTKFYLCTVGGSVSFKCPHQMVFNAESHLCEKSVNCISNCSPKVSGTCV
ncbi:putative chitinase 3 [Penaeus vannamei]|uniref:Putative chitinase 3 n=1 Tax=Penaeus vannamei TaxID=6689 RepID=A0A3R7M988_PENVA|nr:peritrophin-48-like [Penaeus vannamei]ROT70535.1 putative chitinase 3 [Penaeus vannamei]